MQTTSTNSASPSAGVLRAWVPLGLATLSASTQAGVYYSNFPDLVIGPDPDPSTFDGLSVNGNVLFNFAVPSITAAPGFGGLGVTRFTAFDNVQKKGKSFRSERTFIGNGFVSLNLLTAGTLIDASTPWAFGVALADSLSDVFTGVRVETSPGSGSYRYGWIRFSTGPSAGSPFEATTITLKDAAFETTPNTAITIGSVPEASGWAALGFLGLTGGVEAFRRLRARRVS